MSVVAIDYAEMTKAAPQVTALHIDLTAAVTALSGLDFGVEMPPGVKGRVMAQVNAAKGDIQRGAREIDGLGSELARRAHLAKLADTLDKIWGATKPLAVQLGIIAEYSRQAARRYATQGQLGSARQQRRYQLRTERGLRGLGVAGNILGLGLPTVADFLNPNLGADEKFGRAAGRTATTTAVGGASKAASGVAVRGVSLVAPRLAAFAAGGVVGIGVGVAWTVLDEKYDLSPKIAEGATWAAGKVGEGAQAFDDSVLDPTGDFIGDRADDVAEGADDVTPWDGVAPW